MKEGWIWYLAGLITLPVLWLIVGLGADIVGIVVRSVRDTQTIMRGQWRHFCVAPRVFADRLVKQRKALRTGYEITTFRISPRQEKAD